MKKNNLEEQLKRLEELDSQINESTDPDELMKEVNKVINSMSKDLQVELKEHALSVTLKFVNKSNNPDPSFDHEGDSGFDLRANLTHDVIIPEGSTIVIPTGLYFEVNKGLEVQIRSKKGLAENGNIMVLNSPGAVNSSCREEIMIILSNFSDIPRIIRHGDRIAQGVVCPVYGEGNLNIIKVEKLSQTIRDNNNF
jgi:dUTP pyrophosphatase